MQGVLRILYVDDEPDLLDIGKLFLEESGDFTVTIATSGTEAVRLLEQGSFDAIISDYQMPGMDGIQFLVVVRARFGQVPFILFTGKGREEVVIQAINSGADFYLQKGGEPGAQFAELAHKVRQAALRNKAENSLRKSEEKYRHLIEHSNEAILVAQDGMLKLVNHRLIELLGYSEQELLSTQFPVFIHPDDRAMVVERYQKRLKGEEYPSRYSFRLNPKDGNILWVEISAVVIDWDGRPATLNFLTDITERKRAYDSLREEQQFSKLMLDSLPGIFYLYTYPENRMIRWNKQHETLLGYTAEEIKGKLGTDLHLPEYKDAVLKAIDEVMEKGQSSVESTLLAKDGRLLPFFFTGVRFEAPGRLYFMGIGIDISERKRAEETLLKKTEELNASYEQLTASEEELRQNVDDLAKSERALRESENRYRLIDDASLDYIYSYDLGGHFTSANRSLCTAMMLRSDQILGRTHAELGFPDAQCRDWDDLHRKVYDTGTTVTSLTSTPMPDGSIRHYEVVLDPLHDSEGMITGIAGTTRDITDRKHAEEALRESEEKFRVIADYTVNWESWFGPDGKYIWVSPSVAQFTGYSDGEILAMPDFISTVIAKEDRPLFTERFREAIGGASGENFEFRYLHRNGTKHWLNVSWQPIVDRNGNSIGTRASGHNITDRKRSEEALRQANKKLNLLSSITRHDITNQLTILRGYLTILEKKQPDPTLNEYFLKVNTATKRIAAMVQFTKEYEKIGVHAPDWHDCRTLMDIVAKQAPLGKVLVENDLPAGQGVFADPLIFKVFYNLMDNAVRHGGKITTIRFAVEEAGDDHLIVCEDDGDGVVAEEKEKIFERGFGKNTGLGLTLSREILDITGITIHETGEPGKGARFEIVVPKGMWRSIGNDT